MKKYIISNTLKLQVICLVLTACAAPAPQRHPDPQALFDQATALETAGDLSGAVGRYASFWNTFPGHELAPQALYAAAAILDESSPTKAIELYETLLANYPQSQPARRGHEKLFLAYLNQKRFTAATGLFTSLTAQGAAPMWTRLGLKLIGTLMEVERNDEALTVIATLYPFADEASRASLFTLWNQAVPHITDLAFLDGLDDNITDPDLMEALLARKAHLYLEATGGDAARRLMERLAPSLSEDGRLPATNTIGVLLPLSGKWQTVGDKILKGVALSSEVFSSL